MKGTVGLEYIGLNTDQLFAQYAALCRAIGHLPDEDFPRREPAVAEISRDEFGGLAKCWLAGKRDYSKANSKGSRGVYVWYTLEQDKLYWIKDPRSWRCTETYFAAITADGTVCRLSEAQAQEWLNEL